MKNEENSKKHSKLSKGTKRWYCNEGSVACICRSLKCSILENKVLNEALRHQGTQQRINKYRHQRTQQNE